MENRSKHVLGSIISPTQSTFVSGREITNNVFVGFECIHALNNRRQGKDGFVAIKLNMSKAYDRFEWYFLEEITRKMGFSEGWRKRVMNCVKSVSYFILSMDRLWTSSSLVEVRDMGTLFPYLFLLCAKAFSTLLKREES